MKLQKNQYGFSAVEALIIIVILGLIGFVGWFVWHSKQNTNKIQSDTSQTATSTSMKSGSKSQDLVISGWNVKLPSVKSDGYSLAIPAEFYDNANPLPAAEHVNTNDTWDSLLLGVSGMTGRENSCTADKGLQLAGEIDRDTSAKPAGLSKAPAATKKIGNYYYLLYVGYSSNCVANPTPQQQAFLEAVTASFRQLQAN